MHGALSIVLLLGSISLAAAAPQAATREFDPCSLLTSSEIQSVQGERVSTTKASRPERGRFAVFQCFYSLPTFSKSISLDVTRPRANCTGEPWNWKPTSCMSTGPLLNRNWPLSPGASSGV